MIKIILVIALCASIAVTKNIGSRIVGGLPANAGQFKFAAAIYITKTDGNYFCGGALMNNNWVLTAAQCVYQATLFTIKLGSTKLSDTGDNVITLATENYVVHPDFNPNTLEHDLGAIKFRSYIQMTDYVGRLSYLTETSLPASTLVVTLGWGSVSDASAGLSEDLNYIFLTTISNEECRTSYGNQITDNMVCVAGSFNEGTCIGDSGTVLVQYTQSGNFYLAGISSFHSGNGCDSLEPSGFTRTAPYVDWIRTTIQS